VAKVEVLMAVTMQITAFKIGVSQKTVTFKVAELLQKKCKH
jgi:hypothetical protein